MTRILLLLAVLLALSLMVRRAFRGASRDEISSRGARRSNAPGRASRPPGVGRTRARKGANAPPDTLVCGVCGHAFDPEQTGWICPKCGK